VRLHTGQQLAHLGAAHGAEPDAVAADDRDVLAVRGYGRHGGAAAGGSIENVK